MRWRLSGSAQARPPEGIAGEGYVSPDGRLRVCIVADAGGGGSLVCEGFPWPTHAAVLAATTGLPEADAVGRYVSDLVGGASVIVLWSVDGELRDVWVSDDPVRDAAYARPGELVELRHWDGRAWSAAPDQAGIERFFEPSRSPCPPGR